MALRKKPKTEDEFLGQGAATPHVETSKPVEKSLVKFEVRLPTELVEIIDMDRCNDFQKTSRNTWLIDAAVNELKRKGKL